MIDPARATVVISVYKDIEALGIILDALARQSFKGFEVIVSEDGDSEVMRGFLMQYKKLSVVHVYGPDIGWRKNQALNRAIRKSTREYLIFIDGDCVPHSRFVEAHCQLAEHKKVLSGRRVDVGLAVVDEIKTGDFDIRRLERMSYILFNIVVLLRKKCKNLEDGIYVNPDSIFSRIVLPYVSKIRGILGCNFSCWREDIAKINGFDEDYTSPAVGEDTDLEWRFAHFGVHIVSCRNMAIVYHFRHPVRFEGFEENMNIMLKKKSEGKYRCDRGLSDK